MTENSSSKTSLGKIEIIDAAEADDNFLGEVYCSTRMDEFSAVGWSEEQIRHFLLMQYNFQKQAYSIQFPDAKQSIILYGNEKIGRLIVNRSRSDLRLVDISLLPEFRNSGIGTKIINDLITEAAAEKLPLTLHVAHSNEAAFRLYRKLGFSVTGEDDVCVSMEWQKI